MQPYMSVNERYHNLISYTTSKLFTVRLQNPIQILWGFFSGQTLSSLIGPAIPDLRGKRRRKEDVSR